MIEQNPFEAAGTEASIFTDNPSERCPCVLVLDKSSSMAGAPIRQLNEGLNAFYEAIEKDEIASLRVDVAMVTFGPVHREQDFATVDMFLPKILRADGDTPMGEAMCAAVELVEERKETYRANGVAYYRPWIFLITDGAPTDTIVEAERMLRAGVDERKFTVFTVGVQGADMEVLARLSPERPPLRLDGLRFQELFLWLSSSLAAVTRSQSHSGGDPAMRTQLPPPGWTSV